MPDETAKPIKIDVGCGKRKLEGYLGVDKLGFEGVDVVMDCGRDRWPWDDGTVDEVRCSHMVEHLDADERIHFANELYRVLKKGGTAQIFVPYWNSPRAYGDLTHKWPPVSEYWFAYLNKEWRTVNAPHNDKYTCDFDPVQPGYLLRSDLQARNQEYQFFAIANFKDAAQDLMATLVKSK